MISIGTATLIKTVQTRKQVTVSLADIVTDSGLDIYPQVESRGYFSFQFRGRELQLTAGPFVGLIPVNPRLTIDVQPRLPISNMARILEVAQFPLASLESVQRLYEVQPRADISIIEFLGLNLVKALREIEVNGMHKSYVRRSVYTLQPRGHIDFQKTMLISSSHNLRHMVFAEFFEQNMDSYYNQVLKYALWFLAQRLYRMPSRNRELVKSINKALTMFDGVTLDSSRKLTDQVERDLRRNRIPLGKRYYERALRIALTIIAGKGVTLMGLGREVDLASYIVNLEEVFEAYIRQVLRTRMLALRPAIHVKDGNKEAEKSLYDDTKQPSANPDIVLMARGVNWLIADVKYKEKVSREDINQVITYGVCYRARNVTLVHICPSVQQSGHKHLGIIDGINVSTYGYNLDNSSLEQEEIAFADALLTKPDAPV